MSDDPAAIRERAAAVHEAGATLRKATIDERTAWLAEAADRLLGRASSESAALAETTGLSVRMVDWATRTTLKTVDEQALRSLASQARGSGREPIAMLSIILAGNVFTASVRGIVVPLLLGVPVLVKSSSRETSFPAMLRDALRRTDPGLGAAMDLVVFPGGDPEREAALVQSAEAVAVYGSDQTVASIEGRCTDRMLIAHGHGVSAAYCGSRALSKAHIDRTIAALSLDICAYDQRGCLSPQVVFVQASRDYAVSEFAERLAIRGLEPLAKALPRGPLPLAVGAAQAQWRGVAEVEATLILGDTFSICVRDRGPIRWSPGYRNVSVLPVSDVGDAFDVMQPFATSLKCLGTDDASRAAVEHELGRRDAFYAYACELGQMQAPPLDAPADGMPIWHGLLRT